MIATVALEIQRENAPHCNSVVASSDVETIFNLEKVACVGANIPNRFRANLWMRNRPMPIGTTSNAGKITHATRNITLEAWGEYGRDETAIAINTQEKEITMIPAIAMRGQYPRVASLCAERASSTFRHPESTNSPSIDDSPSGESLPRGDSYGFDEGVVIDCRESV